MSLYTKLKSTNLFQIIQQMLADGSLEKELPEIFRLKDREHDTIHHPEGNVLNHVLKSLEQCNSKVPLVHLAILFHDIGKYDTYKFQNNKHTYYAHDAVGVHIFHELNKRLHIPKNEADIIAYCIRNHMRFHLIYQMRKPEKVREILLHAYYPYLQEVCCCDFGSLQKIEQNKLNLAYIEKCRKIIQNMDNRQLSKWIKENAPTKSSHVAK